MQKQQNNYDTTNAYIRTVNINNELGLTPKKPRYSVIGDDCYGVYDDYNQLLADTRGFKNVEVVKEPNNNSWRAIQKCYTGTFKKSGFKYIYEPIVHANEMVILQPVGRLFQRI